MIDRVVLERKAGQFASFVEKFSEGRRSHLQLQGGRFILPEQ
jgi:hypothetical protein